jgi:hypothetical protein
MRKSGDEVCKVQKRVHDIASVISWNNFIFFLVEWIFIVFTVPWEKYFNNPCRKSDRCFKAKFDYPDLT